MQILFFPVYNEDNDDYISAFELSHALDAFIPKGARSVPYTADYLLKKEVEFLNFIKFQTVQVPDEWIQPSREDPLSGLVDRSGMYCFCFCVYFFIFGFVCASWCAPLI